MFLILKFCDEYKVLSKSTLFIHHRIEAGHSQGIHAVLIIYELLKTLHLSYKM